MTHASRTNNFDLLRLLFASLVALVHTAELTRLELLAPLRHLLLGEVAVDGFFVISGFLVFASYERSRSLGHYYSKRLRRILPGYLTVVTLSALGLVLISTLPWQTYFGGEFWRYLLANRTEMMPQ
jgi:peptidoglycan/LPS O-acetylase OafA/YrhL